MVKIKVMGELPLIAWKNEKLFKLSVYLHQSRSQVKMLPLKVKREMDIRSTDFCQYKSRSRSPLLEPVEEHLNWNWWIAENSVCTNLSLTAVPTLPCV